MRSQTIERENDRNERWIARGEYMTLSKSRQMKVSRGVEDLTVDRYRCRGTKHQTQEMRLDRSIRCREAIEKTGTFSIDPLGVEEVSS